jgi:hypothetical protein
MADAGALAPAAAADDELIASEEDLVAFQR